MNLAELVRHCARGAVDLLALYPYAVASTNADGTLELRSLDDRMPDLSRVRLRAEGDVVAEPGARVLVGHEGGDPRRPYAALWDGPMRSLTVTAATKITVRVPSLELGDSGGPPVARDGDIVTIPLGPLPFTGQTSGGAFSGVVLPDPSGPPMVGVVNASSTKVKAR